MAEKMEKLEKMFEQYQQQPPPWFLQYQQQQTRIFSSRHQQQDGNISCRHQHAKYIKVNIEERNPAKIKCPSLFCGQMLDPLSCTQIIPAQLYDKWCDVLCDSTVLRLDTCYCPYRDCSASIVNECGGDVRRSKCPRCKRLFCFRCKQPWHPGYGCEDHQGASIVDLEFEVLEKRNEWKRCPTCKHCVELYEGVGLLVATSVEDSCPSFRIGVTEEIAISYLACF
ncbi:E3 ubiquitin-protein ligase RSL1-like [Cornus florida]|uniref:E3 ubiquitin-protein ligase RSL1-like n=1 Tax=Cornus florida TaxID=4283 RepID=UPI00289C74AA|nr:E3 ubiquitin-protein ligase RSL1-like [Cornus florida]